jgi:hypothetical protein
MCYLSSYKQKYWGYQVFKVWNILRQIMNYFLTFSQKYPAFLYKSKPLAGDGM